MDVKRKKDFKFSIHCIDIVIGFDFFGNAEWKRTSRALRIFYPIIESASKSKTHYNSI